MRPVIQSTTDNDAVGLLAVDGNLTTYSCTLMLSTDPWWSVDLGEPMDVGRLDVTNEDSVNG